ncbi:T9SS type A sorting domain-containing protein [Mesonia sp. K4-1]|uniref:T9SS type A sorting domain-containing protein n=1 Tax=Mesonia sp. K4-1 TaxID=2602760 RepID=UPI0011CAF1EA|nr:T9SS type A sorting domain-containing protein [Mesonia sp. K4-1]TXK71954.1 T9SS type A sorting domain-containing protein [Mesonia sp. K4-1]
MKQKLLFLILLLSCCTWVQDIQGQTLSAGDIAMVGYHTDVDDGFTFIALTDIPASEVIYFTDKGWKAEFATWYGNTEDHIVWTAPGGGLPLGTIVSIIETASDTFTVTQGTAVLSGLDTGFSLLGGDSILAYQSSSGAEPASPTFIAGIYGDDNYLHTSGCDDAGGWHSCFTCTHISGDCTSTSTSTSGIPAGLTNGVNAIALFPSLPEQDNAKYTGTFTGSASTIRALINDPANWTFSDSPVNIQASAYPATSITPDAPACIMTAAITSQTNISCNGGSTGSLTVTATNGDSNYSYVWTKNSTTIASSSGSTSNSNTISGLTAGTYQVTITDSNGCTTTASATVTEPTTLNVTPASQTNIACNGGATGAATVNAATGGAGGYTYNWTPGNPTGDGTTSVSGLSAGTWTCTVTDNNGCTDAQSFTITQPANILSANALAGNVSCNGGNNGTVDLTVTGGTAPYTYAWNNTATTEDMIGLTAGTYSVTITDANGCTATESVDVLEPTVLSANAVAGNVSCNGGNNGTIDLTVTGGTAPYTYTWNNTATTEDMIGLTTGTYSVIVTDANGCTATESVDVLQPAALVANGTVDSNVSTNGGSNGAATVTVTGGTAPYTYAWSNTATTASIAGVIAGTYNVIVTDANGCTATASVTITEPTCNFTASITAQTNVSCNGNGSATVTATGGTSPYTYSWSNGANTATINNLPAGSYTVTITDDNSCTTTATAVITAPGAQIVWGSGSNDPNEDANGRFANPFNTTGSWQAISVYDGNGTPGNAFWTQGAVSQGAYYGSSVGITSPSYTDGAALFDSDFMDNAGVQGAFGLGTSPSPHSGRLISPSFDLSGFNGEQLYIDLYLFYRDFQISELSVGYSNDGGVTWTDVSILQGTSNGTIFNTTKLTYELTGLTNVSDLTNCKLRLTFDGDYYFAIVDDVTIRTAEYEDLSSTITSQININCNGGTDGAATASATGGTAPYSYLWSNAATTASIAGVTAGTYNVTITDGNGCTDTASVTITEPAALITSTIIDENVTCNGANDGEATANATGGTAPYTYLWSNAATTASITGVAAGTYNVTITDDNGCTVTASAIITEPTDLTTNAIATDVFCNGGSDGTVDLTVTGGTAPYTYVWNNTATTEDMTGLTAGTYDVTVTDANGCTTTASATVTEPTALSASATITNVSCNGGSDGSIDLTVTGGTAPYTYVWNNTATTEDMTGLTAGTYDVTVTDANGCTTTASATVTEPTALSAATIATNVSCNGGSDGTVDLTVTGGTAPYTYAWSNTATTEDMTGLTAGTYNVTVTDANGCTTTASATVTEPTALSASAIATDVSCNAGNDGTVDLTVTGGTAPYTYSWSNTATTEDLAGLMSGTYNVTVTDANGCTTAASATIMIADNEAPTAICQDITISLDSTGNVTITAQDVDNGSTDNCSIADYQIDVNTFDCSMIGMNQVILTVTDNNGNVSTCTSTVTVVDDMGPIIDCLDDQTVMGNPNENFFTVPDFVANGDVFAIDNCDGTITSISQNPAVGTLLSEGEYNFTFIATDQLGNTSVCVSVITVDTDLKVDTNTLSLKSLSLFPNPARNQVILVNKDLLEMKEMNIYDLHGRLVKHVSLVQMSNEKTIDISNLQAAVYIVMLKGKNGQIVKQLIKE